MDELTAQRVREYLQDLREIRQKISMPFVRAADWNVRNPDQVHVTDDDIDPEGILRALERDLWQLIGDWEVKLAMGRYHRRLDKVQMVHEEKSIHGPEMPGV